MKHSLIGLAIKAINPSAKFTVHGDNTDTIDWLDGTIQISESDIETKVNELQADDDAKQYQRDRAVAYAEIKEQLDLLYHDMAADKGNKTGEWFKAVKKVKDDNPKE
tara:strand:- start:44 stop:364 length:321 start_codon:yes stop_codon:yes gene_type:complete